MIQRILTPQKILSEILYDVSNIISFPLVEKQKGYLKVCINFYWLIGSADFVIIAQINYQQ
jgi:hypothetical protein